MKNRTPKREREADRRPTEVEPDMAPVRPWPSWVAPVI